MSSLLLIHKDNQSIIIFCPFCKQRYSECDIQNDDYVGSNILLWCNNHCEILFCQTGVRPSEDYYKLEKGNLSGNSCTTIVEDVERFAKEQNFDLPKDINLSEYWCYKIGVLRLTDIHSTANNTSDIEYDSDDEKSMLNIPYKKVNALCFNDIPSNISTEHDGTNLYYKGECYECSRKYTSHIWGD